MSKENFKTLLLAFLVLISIYFVKGFWDTTLHDSSKVYREEVLEDNESNYGLDELILPQKTMVSFNENDKTVMYSSNKYDIWNKGKVVLNNIFSSKEIERNIMNLDINDELISERSVSFEFSQKLYTNIAGKILGIDIPREIYQRLSTMNNIKFTTGENSFLILANSSEKIAIKIKRSYLKEIEKIIDEIEKVDYTKFYKLEDVLGVKKEVYIPVKSKDDIPTVRINAKYNIDKEINLEDAVAELFFYKKIEYIKKLEESNDSSIYMDGENILKIYKDGKLEYIGNMEENNESDLYSSLKRAVDFVSRHKGWPDNAYLSDIENIDINENTKGYKFIFRYKVNGLTVFSDKDDIQDKIEVEVLNGSITSYKSRIWNSLATVTKESETKIMSAFEIIDNNFLFLKEDYIKNLKEEVYNIEDEEISQRVKNSIKDIYLAYYGDLNGQREILKPVWVIEILDKKYLFDAYTGEIKS